MLLAVLMPLLSVLALMGGLWWWSGTDTSLATTLTQVARLLPGDQTLETRDVTGQLRSTGRIGWLRWQQGGLVLEAHDVQLEWQPAALLQQELRVTQLAVGQLRIDDQRPATPSAATLPPNDLSLPFKVNANISVNAVQWAGTPDQSFEKLAFNYIFDSGLHRLDKGYIHILSNTYGFSGSLQAHGPMALQLLLDGTVSTQLPDSKQTLKVAAKARLTGDLAGNDARLMLQATLTPQLAAQRSARATGAGQILTADLSAQLAPWQLQKILSANGRWQALNLAELWPQMPQTRLSGEVTVTPAGQAWQANVDLSNSLVGPWDLLRLPLQSLKAELGYAQGQWLLNTLQANMADGSVRGSGQFSTATASPKSGVWQGLATLQGINLARIDSRLDNTSVDGTLSAKQLPQGISFEANLRSAGGSGATPRPSPSPGAFSRLHLQSLVAQGLWATPKLTLSSLRIDADEAHLQGQMDYNTADLATRGALSLKLPGLQATLDGDLASTRGQGRLTAAVQDAALATRWLARWPAMANTLSGHSLQGSASLSARWQGGWQREAQAMMIDANLRVPRLNWHSTASSTPGERQASWLGRDLQLDVSGTPGKLSLNTRGHLESGTQQFTWLAKAGGGRVKAGAWQANVEQLDLALRDPATASPWLLRLGGASGQASGSPVTLFWLQTEQASTLAVSAGTASMQSPLMGAASVNWQPMRWSQPAHGPAQWHSQGRVDNLPLAWLDAVASKTLTDMDLSSNLMLSGHWNIAQTDSLHASATLERSSGDLRLQTSTSQASAVPAGLRELRLQANLDGGQLSGSLRWDSERFGRALAAFSTQWRQSDQGWVWTKTAPLGGSLKLQLPPVDAWSALAPPGWRLRGTMNADITLTGTRDLPHWSGTLQAQDLAVRSVVDGIDFSNGSLLAQVHDQQIDIQSFVLKGANVASRGAASDPITNQLRITGSMAWLANTSASGLGKRLRMNLQAHANALRLSTRPDRRLTVSGTITTELQEARLSLRGSLTADQALITLPDDNRPQLGDDVVVRRATPTAGTQAVKSPSRPDRASTVTPDVQVELNLGPDFQVRGKGLATRLAGKLTLAAKDLAAPSLTGTVRTVDGTYQAYGQRLEIERGLLRFTGPLDNPALTILAIRPKLSQRVGVQIVGTALAPIVQLYADPDLPDAEKLGWLVLGRSPSGGGGEAALLQQAALALLGGNGRGLTTDLTQALGLDELSFGSAASTDGSTSTASITLGKRLSKDFYVTYESSLNGALGVIYIFYDLSKYLTLRAQTGEQSALDLIFTLRYD